MKLHLIPFLSFFFHVYTCITAQLTFMFESTSILRRLQETSLARFGARAAAGPQAHISIEPT